MIDYFKQLNAFYSQDVAELKQLNGSEVALWNALAYINNKARGLREFTVASSVLIKKSGLKEANFFKTRNTLRQKGLVKVMSGKGSHAASYQMTVLYDLSLYSIDNGIGNSSGNSIGNSSGNSIGNSSDNGIGNSSGNGSALSLNLTKLNSTKKINKKSSADPEQSNRREITPDEFFATEIWPIYPRKMGYGDALEAYKQAITSGLATNEQIIDGIKRYKAYIQVKNIQEGFIKSAEKWLDGQRWHDQYDMTPTTQQGSQQPFKNHEASQEDVQWSSLQGGS
ncbi:hypothetical protein AB0Y04_01060 [Loigolactobacillus coryniformis]|uniref:hypothetical protein n=1 Tax=Loigolactobacillus coryniformis TaxID=1610 RepID=UPI003F23277A